LIDDDPIALQTLAENIKEWGCNVVTAESGRVGLAYFATAPFDIVVADLQMPEMSGIVVCEHILRLAPETPVIVLSADSSSEEVIRAVHEGAFDFVVKSDQHSSLRSSLRRALEHLRLARENAALIARLCDANEALDVAVQERTRALELSNCALAETNVALAEANTSLKTEILERARVETELRLSQKLEAIGQLAAGIAHEINTPMQYVGDSAHFLMDAFVGILKAFDRMKKLCLELAGEERAGTVAQICDELDVDYLLDEAPKALDRTLHGVERVTTIVRAMNDFAHPDQREKAPADINRALENALIVSRNAYKYVAEVETTFGELPPVLCRIGEVNQVFLNLLVNAAHAIADVVGNQGAIGHIRVETAQDGDWVVIRIADSGTGIAPEIQGRIFDPFFTTKAVGKGTGQGLAIARTIVVDRHGGSLELQSRVGHGSTFTIRLPSAGVPPASRPDAGTTGSAPPAARQ
jgi:signal transduction histidine kinase